MYVCMYVFNCDVIMCRNFDEQKHFPHRYHVRVRGIRRVSVLGSALGSVLRLGSVLGLGLLNRVKVRVRVRVRVSVRVKVRVSPMPQQDCSQLQCIT